MLTVAEAKLQSADKPDVGPDPVASEPSAEMKAMAGDLVTLYSYDPAKTYQINLEKTALYARAAASPETN